MRCRKRNKPSGQSILPRPDGAFRDFHVVGQRVSRAKPKLRFITIRKEKRRISEETRCFWSCWADSNCRPHPYQGCALPTELQQQMATKKGLEPSTSGVTGRRSNQLSYLAIAATAFATKNYYNTYISFLSSGFFQNVCVAKILDFLQLFSSFPHHVLYQSSHW